MIPNNVLHTNLPRALHPRSIYVFVRWVFIALLLTSLIACTDKGGFPQDISSIQGCWVDRGSPSDPPDVWLNLLPDPLQPERIAGTLLEMSDGKPRPIFTISFAQDGSTVTFLPSKRKNGYPQQQNSPQPVVLVATPPPPISLKQKKDGVTVIAYTERPGSDWVVVASSGDHLTIYNVHEDGSLGQGYFSGKREACGAEKNSDSK